MDEDKIMIEIDKKLIEDIRTFTAKTNNYLMTIPVDGDDILRSADLMNFAKHLCEALDELK